MDQDDTADVWAEATNILKECFDSSQITADTEVKLLQFITHLSDVGLVDLFISHFFGLFRARLTGIIEPVPPHAIPALNELCALSKTCCSVSKLFDGYFVKKEPLYTQIRRIARTLLQTSPVGLKVKDIFLASAQQSFLSHQRAIDEDLDDSVDVSTKFDEEESLPFTEIFSSLRWLGVEWADVLVMQTCSIAVEKRTQVCSEEFDSPQLEKLLEWIDTIVLSWLTSVYGDDKNTTSTKDASAKLKQLGRQMFCSLRIKEMFDIIIDFPSSEPVLIDLSAALQHTDQQQELISSLRAAIQKRLLHPGADTSSVIDTYVALIKGLHVLDPTGITLAIVGEPIRTYLRGRDDAVRCVAQMLTEDESEGGLLNATDSTQPNADLDVSDDEDVDAMEWTPAPLLLDHAQVSRSKKQDILGTLISIYGGPELFVSEYRGLLADRLLELTNFRVEKELRTVELLRLRFGAERLQKCEVMLKDLNDSRRMDTLIHETADPSGLLPVTHATIISSLFWPKLDDSEFSLPPAMATALEKCGTVYHEQKKPRKLHWYKTLGKVDVSLSFEDGREVEASVRPVIAAVILKFEEQSSWSVGDLALALEITKMQCHRRIQFWVKRGVLMLESAAGTSSDKETYCVVEYSKEQEGLYASRDLSCDDIGSPKPVQSKANEDDEVIQTFVMNMLKNFESLGLDRIHSMLKIFLTDPPFSKSLEDLRNVLKPLVRDDMLTFSGGVYKLPGK